MRLYLLLFLVFYCIPLSIFPMGCADMGRLTYNVSFTGKLYNQDNQENYSKNALVPENSFPHTTALINYKTEGIRLPLKDSNEKLYISSAVIAASFLEVPIHKALINKEVFGLQQIFKKLYKFESTQLKDFFDWSNLLFSNSPSNIGKFLRNVFPLRNKFSLKKLCDFLNIANSLGLIDICRAYEKTILSVKILDLLKDTAERSKEIAFRRADYVQQHLKKKVVRRIVFCLGFTIQRAYEIYCSQTANTCYYNSKQGDKLVINNLANCLVSFQESDNTILITSLPDRSNNTHSPNLLEPHRDCILDLDIRRKENKMRKADLCLAVHPTKPIICVQYGYTKIKLYDRERKKVIGKLNLVGNKKKLDYDLINSITFNHDGSLLAVGTFDDKIYIATTHGLQKKHTFKIDNKSGIEQVLFLNDTTLLVVCLDSTIMVCPLEFSQKSAKVTNPVIISTYCKITAVAFNAAEKLLAINYSDQKIELFKNLLTPPLCSSIIKKPTLGSVLKDTSKNCMTFSADGSLLCCSNNKNKEITIYDSENNKEIFEKIAYRGQLKALHFVNNHTLRVITDWHVIDYALRPRLQNLTLLEALLSMQAPLNYEETSDYLKQKISTLSLFLQKFIFYIKEAS